MTRALVFLALCLLSLLSACAVEPVGDCVIVAADRREVLRAAHEIDPRIPARILGFKVATAQTPPEGHAVLVFHLDHSWFAYDALGTRPLKINQEGAADILPIVAARAAFPGWYVSDARWLD